MSVMFYMINHQVQDINCAFKCSTGSRLDSQAYVGREESVFRLDGFNMDRGGFIQKATAIFGILQVYEWAIGRMWVCVCVCQRGSACMCVLNLTSVAGGHAAL